MIPNSKKEFRIQNPSETRDLPSVNSPLLADIAPSSSANQPESAPSMLDFSRKLFREIDVGIENYIKSSLCTMTYDRETHFRWKKENQEWSVEKIGPTANLQRAFFHSCIHLIDNKKRQIILADLYKNIAPGGRIFISTMGNQLEVPLPPSASLEPNPHPKELVGILNEFGFITMIDKFATKLTISTEEYKKCLRNKDSSDLSPIPIAEIERFCRLLPETEFMEYYQSNWIICGIKLEAHNPKIGIQKSPTHGIGAYCKHEINKGEIIIPLITEEITQKGIKEPSEWHSKTNSIARHMQRTTYGLINHRNEPNCKITEEFGVISIKKIPAGEELFLNYSENPLPEEYGPAISWVVSAV